MAIKNLRIKNPVKTLSEWVSSNPVLLDGEIVIINDEGKYRTKIGNGTSTFSQLDFTGSDTVFVSSPNDIPKNPSIGSIIVFKNSIYDGYYYDSHPLNWYFYGGDIFGNGWICIASVNSTNFTPETDCVGWYGQNATGYESIAVYNATTGLRVGEIWISSDNGEYPMNFGVESLGATSETDTVPFYIGKWGGDDDRFPSKLPVLYDKNDMAIYDGSNWITIKSQLGIEYVKNYSSGSGASATTGFAGGQNAYTTDGAAIGYGARASGSGGSVGRYSSSSSGGGAIGSNAYAFTGGGAIGSGTISGMGFSGGSGAKAGSNGSGGYIDTIQLGTGTNTNAKTLQVYNYTLMDANGFVPNDRLSISISGVYTGTSSVNQSVELGFQPSSVIVVEQATGKTIAATSTTAVLQNAKLISGKLSDLFDVADVGMHEIKGNIYTNYPDYCIDDSENYSSGAFHTFIYKLNGNKFSGVSYGTASGFLYDHTYSTDSYYAYIEDLDGYDSTSGTDSVVSFYIAKNDYSNVLQITDTGFTVKGDMNTDSSRYIYIANK